MKPPHGKLADAQYVIARGHGFTSWATFAKHLKLLQRQRSPVAVFEEAADAIVGGDIETLARLLRASPDLVRMRSTRQHHATLLHYVSANGVEGYRQKSPQNAAAIAKLLLDGGAEVDATAGVYNGNCTALGLVATSAPPAIAGVQLEVIDALLAYGARKDLEGSVGNNHSLVYGCLANGQPKAAEYLADRGAPLDLPGAAGLGRVEVVDRLLDDDPQLPPHAGLRDAFYMASAYGRLNVVNRLLERGVAADLPLTGHGAGHTALHVAAFHGHVDVVSSLLQHGADVHAIDNTWGTPPILWALTGWAREEANAEQYHVIVAALIAAGATLRPDVLGWEKLKTDPKMRAILETAPPHNPAQP
jgi:ankyrin repeat protein